MSSNLKMICWLAIYFLVSLSSFILILITTRTSFSKHFQPEIFNVLEKKCNITVFSNYFDIVCMILFWKRTNWNTRKEQKMLTEHSLAQNILFLSILLMRWNPRNSRACSTVHKLSKENLSQSLIRYLENIHIVGHIHSYIDNQVLSYRNL